MFAECAAFWGEGRWKREEGSKKKADEAQWDESFSQTQEKLAAFAQQARKETAEGKAIPMDFEKL